MNLSAFWRMLMMVGLLLPGGSSTAIAQDIPYRGTVTSVEQNSALSFECSGTADKISCDFIQTLVSQEAPASPEAKANMVQAALEEGASTSLCSSFLDTLRASEDDGSLSKLDERAREEAARYLGLLEEFCAGPNEAKAAELFDMLEDRKARSCKIASLPFSLSLTWNSQSARWESVSQPEGSCGIVTMVFMRPDQSYPSLWNYDEQTLVTNKAGTDAIRGDCSAWPEELLSYKWQPETLNRVCEYVSFGF